MGWLRNHHLARNTVSGRITPWDSVKWSGPPEGRCGKHWLDEPEATEREEDQQHDDDTGPAYTLAEWDWIREEQRLAKEKERGGANCVD